MKEQIKPKTYFVQADQLKKEVSDHPTAVETFFLGLSDCPHWVVDSSTLKCEFCKNDSSNQVLDGYTEKTNKELTDLYDELRVLADGVFK